MKVYVLIENLRAGWEEPEEPPSRRRVVGVVASAETARARAASYVGVPGFEYLEVEEWEVEGALDLAGRTP